MKTKYIAVPVSDKEVIVNYLDKQIQKYTEYDCMPENEEGSYFVSRTSISKIVDGLIPLVKSTFVKKKVLKEVPDHSEEMLSALSEIMRFKHELRLVMSDKLQYPDNFLKALDNAEELINKVKDNGK
ncbi:hypothetical protein [Elizabethkingia anophelis]|uniref:hypothetical protein n=1 Tax=Elizabethkingia anophelis TaxID=1117645 RepID=UPI000DD80246|nr:hypothetical protein [Elizabethkingia anophelis]MDC8024873.1 hypothetical protein [Elizabethkingia anophelis]RBA36147.1 hypothetical protein DSC50_02025 [Elizabethkingia anophelis]